LEDWKYVDSEAEERLCHVEQYGIRKTYSGGEIEFIVSVREYREPPDPAMRFFAQADKHTNQKSAPYIPCGWGPNLSTALWECIKAIRKFPYEP
jgi:hypothetical protein